MLLYLLKSGACLAIFMMFYKLFLEKENMHQFKRYYLIVALVLAFCIPIITITYYIDPAPNNLTLQTIENDAVLLNLVSSNSGLNWILALWTLYGLGVLLFTSRFLYNLFAIYKTIKHNPKHKSSNFINVLLEQLKTPHTFFSYIFLDKYLYETRQIPNEVIIHEQTHARQKHSLDILFIELVQIIFWFNPLIHLFKKDIKLNHEFLADQAVLNHGTCLSTYQELLLTFSSNAKEPQLAHAINYSFIKKRFTIMKTKSSKQRRYSKVILLLPLFAITLLSFSEHKEILKEDMTNSLNIDSSDSKFSTAEDLNSSLELKPLAQDKEATLKEVEEYNALARHYNNMPKKNMNIKKKDVERLEYLYGIMTKEQKAKAEPFPSIKIPPPPPPAPKAPEPGKVLKGEKMPPPPPIPASASEAQKAKMQKAIDHHNTIVPPPPPPPPAPKSAIEHIMEMSEKGAEFYYEGKSISAKEAISLVKKNEHLHIATSHTNLKQPKVEISKTRVVKED
ncbi:beta-lactamase regulating signal transducer with metallopeptidase domain [Flavobacteriaceae bacterium MAR_2010_105]|nr:beta-lactamase regulating signal transducer with metallopeptidase domain [Flavobacteriaceae bacterium MAR_2010_105]